MAYKVAIFSSTDGFFGSAFDTAFRDKLTTIQPGEIQQISASGDYDKDSVGNIKNQAANIEPTVQLIVAVGGLVSAEAVSALNKSQYSVPFLVVVGRTPKPKSNLLDDTRLLGGVDLDSSNQNITRANGLKNNLGVNDLTKICLYYNDNAHMGEQEANEWRFHGGMVVKSSVKQKSGQYNKQQFISDFNNQVPRSAQAIIISADPFFSSKASDLAGAIATSSCKDLPVCYPNAKYESYAKKGNSLICGANLVDAYKILGDKANTYLSAAEGSKPDQLGIDILPPETKVVSKKPFKAKNNKKSK